MFIPRKRLFWAVSLGHLTNDTFISMVPVLLAFLSITILPMSNTQIGFIVSAAALLGALSQPFFGLRADRSGGRWLGALGLAWNAGMLMIALAVALLTRQYWLMALPLIVMALGSGALHPVGMLHVAHADRRFAASSLAIFFLMGQIGLALGPALAGLLLEQASVNGAGPYTNGLNPATAPLFTPQADLTPIFLLGLLAGPVILWMATSIPSALSFRGSTEEAAGPRKSAGSLLRGLPLGALALLAVMVALRGLAQPGSVSFIPVLFSEKGWSPAQYGLITSSFWIASGLAGVLFGRLADRYDRRHVIALSLLLSAPAFFLLPALDGAGAFLLAVLAGGLSGGSHSIIIVLAQDLIPARKGFAGGASLGFIFATGALGSLLIGGVSDIVGLSTTFQIVAVTTVLAALLGLLLPGQQDQDQAAPAAQTS